MLGLYSSSSRLLDAVARLCSSTATASSPRPALSVLALRSVSLSTPSKAKLKRLAGLPASRSETRLDMVLADLMDLAGVSSGSESPALTAETAVVVRTWDEAGKKDDDPRTVWVEVVDAFLRRTWRRSGDRGGGSGAVDDWLSLVGEADRLDFVGEAEKAKDLLLELEGRRSVVWLGGDCSIGWSSECLGSGELREFRPLILATRFDIAELRSRSFGCCKRG